MNNRLSRLVAGIVCAAALLALPFASSCSSIVSMLPSPFGSPASSSSAVEEPYYLGVDEDGNLALYKGEPGNGAEPIRTTDIAVADLHESVAEGLKQGIKFDSFNEAVERIGDYREAAKANAESKKAEQLTAEEEAAQVAPSEAERIEADAAAEKAAAEKAAAEKAAAEQAAAEEAAAEKTAGEKEADQQPAAQQPQAQQEPSAPAASEPAQQPASQEQEQQEQESGDEYAAAGEFWGVWLAEYDDLEAAYAAADRAKEQGFTSEVFELTNWGSANYVVGAGKYATKTEAQAVLNRAKELGYSSAYLHTAATL